MVVDQHFVVVVIVVGVVAVDQHFVVVVVGVVVVDNILLCDERQPMKAH